MQSTIPQTYLQRLSASIAALLGWTTTRPPTLGWVEFGRPEIAERNAFMRWLRNGLLNHQIPINKPRAYVHTVPEGLLLVSPRAFQVFASDDWKHVQQRFLRLGVHRRWPGGVNFCTYRVRNRRKRLKGVLIDDPVQLFGFGLPEPNRRLSLMLELDPPPNAGARK